jgi:hypothetical protein
LKPRQTRQFHPTRRRSHKHSESRRSVQFPLCLKSHQPQPRQQFPSSRSESQRPHGCCIWSLNGLNGNNLHRRQSRLVSHIPLRPRFDSLALAPFISISHSLLFCFRHSSSSRQRFPPTRASSEQRTKSSAVIESAALHRPQTPSCIGPGQRSTRRTPSVSFSTQEARILF